jgi:hypothetical protein
VKTLDVSSADFLDMAESPSYNRLSFGGASVSFRAPVSRFASCPFEEGEIVKVVWRGKTLLIGPVIDLEHSLEGTSESWDIRIYDYWWNLKNIQYFVNGRANGIFAKYRQGTGGSGQEKQATANIRDALSGVLDHAISTALVPIKYDLRIDKDAEIIPFAYSSETYASLLVQVQQWRPNMAAWFEYGADDSATLVIADHAHLPDVVLDLSAVDVSALSLKARQERRDEAQQRNTEAKQKNAVKKEEEDRIQKLAEVQMREQQEQLKKKIREQEKKEKEQEQQYKESLKNPDLSRPGQKRGVKEALNKVSKELAPEIRKAMADGKISTEESKDLSRQFIEAVKAQGIAYRGNLETLTSYFQETLNIIQQQAVNAAEAQKTTESLKAQLESVKKQVITIQRQRKNSR